MQFSHYWPKIGNLLSWNSKSYRCIGKGGLISERYSLRIKSPQKGAKNYPKDRKDKILKIVIWQLFLVDLSQSKTLSEIKPPFQEQFSTVMYSIEAKGSLQRCVCYIVQSNAPKKINYDTFSRLSQQNFDTRKLLSDAMRVETAALKLLRFRGYF